MRLLLQDINLGQIATQAGRGFLGNSTQFFKYNTILLLIGAISYWFMSDVRLFGDENNYIRQSQNLALAIERWDFSRLDLVGFGWFMPGMSFISMPATIFVDGLNGDLNAHEIRWYFVLLNGVMLFLIARKMFPESVLRRNAFYAILLLHPYYVTHMAGVSGETVAIHLALLTLLYLPKLQNLDTILALLLFAFALATLTYLRANYFLVGLVMIAIVFVRYSYSGKVSGTLIKSTIFGAGLYVAVIGLLSPWSMSISSKYGPTTLLSSTQLTQLVLLRSPDYGQYIIQKYGDGSVFEQVHAEISERAEKEGLTFAQASKLEYEQGVAAPGTEDRSRPLRNNIDNFFMWGWPSYLEHQLNFRCSDRGKCLPDGVKSVLIGWNQIATQFILIAGALLVLVPFGMRRQDDFYLPLIFKALMFLAAMHPFLVTAHNRYINQFTVLVALAIASLSLQSIKALVPASENRLQTGVIWAGQVFAIGLFILLASNYLTGSSIFLP